MNEAKQKDDILRSLIGKSHEESKDVATNFSIEHDYCVKLLKHMHHDGNLAALNAHADGIYFVTKLSTKGELFLDNGGYEGMANVRQKEKIQWFVSKAWAVFIGLTTLALTTYQIYLTDKTNDIEKKNEDLQTQVDSLIKASVRQR